MLLKKKGLKDKKRKNYQSILRHLSYQLCLSKPSECTQKLETVDNLGIMNHNCGHI